MRKTLAVLSENKVFSTVPNTYSYGWKSNLEDRMVQKEGDTYFLVNPPFGDESNKLYQYDPIESYFREERLKRMYNRSLDLAFAKKVVVDEHFPAYKEFWLTEGDGLNEDFESTVSVHDFYLEGGRNSLVRLIADCRYSEAIPELREIALHDDEQKMRQSAIFALGSLDRQKADKVVNEVLGLETDRYRIMDIVMYLHQYSLSGMFVSNLRKKFEEQYHDYVDNWLALKYFHTVTQSIIMVCSRILTAESLALIEDGIRHPYAHVESNARSALAMWLERVAKSENAGQQLVKKAVEIGKKYEAFYSKDKLWKSLKKSLIIGYV